MSLECTAHVAAAQVSCAPAQGTGGALGDVIYGGQYRYVTLSSTNQVIADTFAMDVTVRNLLRQPIGTSDGVTADPGGVKVFFVMQPVATGGSGQISIQNPDGYGMFTEAGQPFYRYAGVLGRDATSPPRRWKFVLAPGVTSFRFLVNIAAPVPFPNGWVQVSWDEMVLYPEEGYRVSATVYDALGDYLPGETVVWSSSDPDAISVTPIEGSPMAMIQRTGRASAVVTARSGARSGSMIVYSWLVLEAASRGATGIGPVWSYVDLGRDARSFYYAEGATAGGRGITLATVEPVRGEITSIRTYDTPATRTDGVEMTALVQRLKSLPNGTIVMLAVGEDAGLNVERSCARRTEPWVEEGVKALEALGSRKIRGYCYQDSWSMVAVVGEGTARAESFARWEEASAVMRIRLQLPPATP